MPTLYNPGKKKGIFYIPSGGTKSPTPTPSFSNTKSILFDGVDDYVNVGNITALISTNTFSISLWFKNDAFSTDKVLIANSFGGSSQFFIETKTGGIIASSMSGAGSSTLTMTPPLVLDTWYNLVYIFDGLNPTVTDRAKFYLNAVDITPPYTNYPQVAPPFSVDWLIGAYKTSLLLPHSGNIDEVSIYTTALTQLEVDDNIYNTGTPDDISGITGINNWWRMGDKVIAFPTIPDQIGSNDGTAYNENEATMIVEDVP